MFICCATFDWPGLPALMKGVAGIIIASLIGRTPCNKDMLCWGLLGVGERAAAGTPDA